MVKKEKLLIGWREWISMPELNVKNIRAKIDTGAKTSSLHAEDIKVDKTNSSISFYTLHYVSKNKPYKRVLCKAKTIGTRNVTSSNGLKEKRWLIKSTLKMGSEEWPIELNLTSRDTMKYNILLGREALNGHCIIDPQKSFLLGKFSQKNKKKVVSK